MKLNVTESLFKILLSEVPEGSILGPILFSIFINNLLFFTNEGKLVYFADDNTIYPAKRDLNKLLRLLEKESEVAIKWFSVNRQNRSNHNCCLTINNAEIKSTDSVTLIGIEIDNKLNVEKHVSTICKMTNNQLNAISRIGAVLGQKEKELTLQLTE